MSLVRNATAADNGQVSVLVAEEVVTDLGGAIDVSTAVGHSTTFTIWLPLAGETTAPSAEVATALPRGHGQTVMIVDDEKALVALAEEMLAELGYEPIGFTSSVAALDTFREAPRRIDIVLTDETMPALIGTDLAREISQLRPDPDRTDERLPGTGGSKDAGKRRARYARHHPRRGFCRFFGRDPYPGE